MVKEKILVIEDDPDILELLQYNLERAGYKVRNAMHGETGLKEAEGYEPDLIILDIMLPGMDGLNVCKKLRQKEKTSSIPIIMLTAKGEESDVVAGLELGADDYVTKPFSPNELVARMRAVLRRPPPVKKDQEVTKVECGPIKIDSERHEAYLGQDPMALTLAEFNLLKALVSQPGRVFTRDQLLESITGGDTYLIDRNIDVHIRAIRKKLGEHDQMIQTVRGVGYKCKD